MLRLVTSSSWTRSEPTVLTIVASTSAVAATVVMFSGGVRAVVALAAELAERVRLDAEQAHAADHRARAGDHLAARRRRLVPVLLVDHLIDVVDRFRHAFLPRSICLHGGHSAGRRRSDAARRLDAAASERDAHVPQLREEAPVQRGLQVRARRATRPSRGGCRSRARPSARGAGATARCPRRGRPAARRPRAAPRAPGRPCGRGRARASASQALLAVLRASPAHAQNAS